ncbi:MAG: hypothetical protein QM523_00905 [Candidatus Pacebacteria bacterium]|nr:hypothetical protein [Candidatus Paceibacterota bacterium]
MTRNLTQKEQAAHNILRRVRDSGITDDDEIIAEAERLMGKNNLPLIRRVFARHFKPTEPF